VNSYLKDRLEILKTFYFRNPKSRFIVVLGKTFKETEKEISRFLWKLWEFKIINYVVLLQRKAFDTWDVGAVSKVLEKSLDVWQFGHVIGVYTWFPYRDLENCYDLRKWKTYPKIFLFPNKLKNNLDNCQIIISTTETRPFPSPIPSPSPVCRKSWLFKF